MTLLETSLEKSMRLHPVQDFCRERRQRFVRWADLTPRRGRRLVLAAALVMLGLKLYVTVSTSGTNDIRHWTVFTNLVQRYGPVGVYAHHVPGNLYNHPPLMGYFLELVTWGRDLGIPVRISIRVAAEAADLVTALLVFELVRRRRSLPTATASGLLMAVTPVLFTISAFHGNTDPIFTMLVFLSVYLLADRHAPVWAGVTIALALGVKIVPVVVVPSLLVFAWKLGRREFVRFAAAGVATLAITWGPAVLLEWAKLKANVLSYPGLGLGQWGLVQFGHWAGDPGWVGWLKGGGRMVIVALCALLPAVAVWRRPQMLLRAAAVALAMFLALSPAFAVQYLAWAAAATCLLGLWWGVFYNLTAGALLFAEYSRWSGAFPWTDKKAFYSPATPGETVFAVVVWAILVAAVWRAIIELFAGEGGIAPPTHPERRSGTAHTDPGERHLARQASRHRVDATAT